MGPAINRPRVLPPTTSPTPPGTISRVKPGQTLANIKEAIELVLEVQREELHRKSQLHNREISKVEVADVA